MIDHQDISALTEALLKASAELGAMSESVAMAKQVKEYDSDRRKRALAEAMSPLMDAGASAAAAEYHARASAPYRDALIQLGTQLRDSLKTIEKHEAALINWKSLQSALSCLKTVAGNV